MTPKNPFDMLLTADVDRLVHGNKRAQKALAKAGRKLKAARSAKKLTEIRLLLGMARVALDKAEFIARSASK